MPGATWFNSRNFLSPVLPHDLLCPTVPCLGSLKMMILSWRGKGRWPISQLKSRKTVRICLLWIPNWNGNKHVTSQLYPLLGMVLLLCGSACQAAQPMQLEEGLNMKCFKNRKGVHFCLFCFPREGKGCGI